MSDLISRQAAIDLLKQMRKDGDMVPWEGKDVFARIRKLPSAQPDVPDTNVGEIAELEKYKKAFSVACELLIGASLFGVTEETMFAEIMERDGIVSSLKYEKYILDNLARLTGEDDGTAHDTI